MTRWPSPCPCYPGLFDILGGLGNPIAPLRADRSGILPESLDAVLAAGGAGVVYVQAGPHNPTGFVTPPQRLRALAAVLDAHDAAVVEDLTLADLAYDGRPALDLAHLCRSATVVSVGSFSKVLWGGLRVGWIRGPIPVIDRTLLRRLAVDLGPATPSQLLCLALLPHLDDIVAERRRFLEANVRRGAALLADEVPEWNVAGAGRRLGAVDRDAARRHRAARPRRPPPRRARGARDRSPSRGSAPTRTCGSASTGRGRSSRPACSGSARRGATSPSDRRRIAG